MRGALRLALAALFATGCGSRWSTEDARSAGDAARMEGLALRACAGDAGCPAPEVRALERAAYCSSASMLARHGDAFHDGGVSCLP